jgi:putative transposase
MREWQSQSHVKWYCRYHVVIVPKYRRKSTFGAIRCEMGEIIQGVVSTVWNRVVEGHVMVDHVHMCLGYRRSTVWRIRWGS